MANINSKYRVSNGTDYEAVYHFETNTGVILTQDGRMLDEVFEGKRADGQNLSVFKKDGKYLVTNSVGLPTGLTTSLTYLLKVETVDSIVWQTLYDHVGNNIYTRCMTELGFSTWSNGGKDIQDKVGGLVDKVDNIEFDVQKNTEAIKDHNDKIENILEEMGQEVTAHNHDERYVKKEGGIYTGHFGMDNGVSLVGNTTDGNSKNIAKVNESNIIVFGDNSSDLDIVSRNNVKINGQEVVHVGNIGEHVPKDFGDVYANERNIFSQVQTFEETVKIKSSKGLRFEDFSGSIIGHIVPDSSDLVMKLGGSEVFRLRSSDNALMASQKLILQGNDRVWFRMGIGVDQGVGFTGSSSTNSFSMYDWGKARTIYNVDRNDNCVDFANSIKIQGKKLTIGYQPANPSVGDICII